MSEATVHTFDLSGPVCDCGRVHAAPTHTITHLPPREWEMPIPGTPLPPWSPIPMTSGQRPGCLLLDGSVIPVPTLSPEWADRLWELAQQPERPSLERARKVRVRVDPRLPPDWIELRYDFNDVAYLPSAYWLERELLVSHITTHAGAAALLAFGRIDGFFA